MYTYVIPVFVPATSHDRIHKRHYKYICNTSCYTPTFLLNKKFETICLKCKTIITIKSDAITA